MGATRPTAELRGPGTSVLREPNTNVARQLGESYRCKFGPGCKWRSRAILGHPLRVRLLLTVTENANPLVW